MEEVTIQDVLSIRNKRHTLIQEIDESAYLTFDNLRDSYLKHFENFNSSDDGWRVGSNGEREWRNVIYCPDFSPNGEMIYRKRSKTSQLYRTIFNVIKNGFVHPHLQVCKIVDSTHPIRFATPPEEECYTAIYTGPDISAKSERIIFGEYTGVVYHNNIVDEQRFEYVFDLSFNKQAWLYKRINDSISLPSDGEYILDSSNAFNELSLVNHYQVISLFGNVTMKKNCEWQQVFFDGWPHVILTSIPGVEIKSGEELLADFGNEWFTKVTEMSHKLIARELLEYRVGIRNTPVANQCLKRDISVIDKSADPLVLESKDQPCAICNSVDRNKDENEGGVRGKRGRAPSTKRSGLNEVSENKESEESGESMPLMVYCDGCDRPFHISCLKEVIPSLDSIRTEELNAGPNLTPGMPRFRDPLEKWFCYYCRRLALDIFETDNRSEINTEKCSKFVNYNKNVNRAHAKPISSPFSNRVVEDDSKKPDLVCNDSIGSASTMMSSTISIESTIEPFYDSAHYNDYNKDFNAAKYIFGEVFENPFKTFGDRIKVCRQCISTGGELASVYVCRVVKRHIGGNHDHPHNLKSMEIKEMLLEFYQQQIHFYIRLSIVKNVVISYLSFKNQRYYHALNDLFSDGLINTICDNVLKRKKLITQSTFESIGGFENEINTLSDSNTLLEYINNIIKNNWYVFDEFSPENSSNATSQPNSSPGKELGLDKTVPSKKPIKRFVPLLGVWVGETSVLRKFNDGYYQGIITDYNDEIQEYTTVFKLSYPDGDEEYIQPEDLAFELIDNIINWRRIGNEIRKEGDFEFLDRNMLDYSPYKILSDLIHPRFNEIREL